MDPGNDHQEHSSIPGEGASEDSNGGSHPFHMADAATGNDNQDFPSTGPGNGYQEHFFYCLSHE